MNLFSNSALKILAISILFLSTFVLRFSNLSYSDYQGDEIRAIYTQKDLDQGLDYLLNQRKGPMQFLVTLLTSQIIGGDAAVFDYFSMRLPFALAGVGSVIVFYLYVAKFLSFKASVFSSLLLSFNGIFVAFSRIVQYQMFVVFFGLLSVLLAHKAFNEPAKKWIFYTLSFLSLALSILFHYDGVFFAIMILYYLLSELTKDSTKTFRLSFVKNTFLASVPALLVLLSFYVPFVLTLSGDTLAYWKVRISDPTNKISSSIYTFNLYQPYFMLICYFLLSIISIIPLVKFLVKKSLTHLFIILWFIVPFIFMELLVNVPGTHIYTYLIPAIMIFGFGLDYLGERFLNKFVKVSIVIFYFLITAFGFTQSYFLFSDSNEGYPWREEIIFGFKLQTPSDNYHLSIFGFPYNRGWRSLAKELESRSDFVAYSSNEKGSITEIYFSCPRSTMFPYYYFAINNPQALKEFAYDPVKRPGKWNFVRNIYNDSGQEYGKIYYVTKF